LRNNSAQGRPSASAGGRPGWATRLAAVRQALLTSFRRSLRAQAAIGIAVPVLLGLIEFSVVRYWREDQFATDQTQLAISQLGQVVTSSLRHAMLENDQAMLTAVISDVGQTQSFRRVDIIDLQGKVWASSLPSEVGRPAAVVGWPRGDAPSRRPASATARYVATTGGGHGGP
jgi:hypothetical protein